MLGQDHVVQTLCNAIEQKRLAHAYLFVGPRGTGKTSTARIFAKALNCSHGPRVDFDPDEDICEEIAEGRSLDVLEIDGASNRGIDNIRDLRDNVHFAPARGQFRIIYIDEVHMLTKESFNALLKTLEEPPEHVKFIFATTEPHKILPTILSRCQRFDLRPIPADVIAKHLITIASNESVRLSETAAMSIARVADGGMRDAQSMLDQLVSFCGHEIEEQHVNEIFGVTSRDTVAQALCYILDRQLPSLLQLTHDLAEAGRDMGQLLGDLMDAVRELLVQKVSPEYGRANIPDQWREPLSQLLSRTPSDKLIRLMEMLASSEERMRWSSNKRLHLEMGLIQAVHALSEANISDIVRALNGATLPDASIAAAALPPVAAVAIPTATPQPVLAAAPIVKPAPEPIVKPAPEPIVKPAPEPFTKPAPEPVAAPAPTPIAEPAPSPIKEASSLPPIDDPAPSFSSDEPPADLVYADEEPLFEGNIIPLARTIIPMSTELWARCLEQLRERHPIQAGAIGETLFISDNKGELAIALHPTDTYSRDALLSKKIRNSIAEISLDICGRACSLRITNDASIPAPIIENYVPAPLPEIAPPVAKKATKKSTATATTAATPERKPEKPLDESFYNDPLIELALKEFHARIINT